MIRAEAFASQAELQRRIAVGVHEAMPRGAVEVVWTYREAGRARESAAEAVFADGTRTPVEPVGDVLTAAARLRHLTYRPDHGAWFTLRVTITAAQRVSLRYDRDEEPDWMAPPSDVEYARDALSFPRSPDRTPAWLAERIERGHASDPRLKKRPWWRPRGLGRPSR